ncbi:type II secretion system protein G [Candidatus Scalindua japonica]|uniref:Type II secretion system protein G n=1 Tax=Candidatus Scalindua japonica TaxID=1284222 RepID=A0A286TY97_9BACT|nr:type II secretion system protein GspG [Candidatus Scalindua japonica]GAX60868.1 type II secretion system protein G [Candidatus Scalindua japonica]
MISITGKRGFTLMELLVVIGIIIIIAASVLTVIPGMRQKAQEKATKAFMDRLEIAIEQYYDDNRIYPSTGNVNLKSTLQPSDSTSKQYIEFDGNEVNNGDIIDQWGNPFVYVSSTDASPDYNTTTYDLYSTGMDGTSTTFGDDTDDINNWGR